MANANVAILLTPPGPAAIAVVRVSGPLVAPFLARRFSRPVQDARCVHGTFVDESGDVLDDPVVVTSRGGTVADLNLHGGPWVVQSVLNLLERAGFVLRHARDVAELAHDADGVMEREVLAHLPLAATELGLRALLAQPQVWAEATSRLSDDDLRQILDDESLIHLLRPPQVAIVGAPNVGKSTLANQLFAQERSITADVPGTTRDWVGEVANVDGLAVMLVDTPGVRETPDPIEREAIERSGEQVRAADLVILVLDATRPLEPEQTPLLRTFPDAMTVVNKSDGRAAGWTLDEPEIARLVATTGEGVDQLRHAIKRHFDVGEGVHTKPHVWTARQRAVIAAALHDRAALDGL